jgi:AcrR family transcriptional regulator
MSVGPTSRHADVDAIRAGDLTAATALGQAALRALPVVRERRGTAIRDTEIVARELALAAVDLFATQGYDDVTVAQIAASAGVNKRTVFRYFPTKETVVLDIWDQTNESLVQRIERSAEARPLDALSQAVLAWLDEFEELLAGLSMFAEQSRALGSVTALHAAEWEEHISQALIRRFPELDPDVAAMAGVIAMGTMRIAQKRVLASGRTFAEEAAALVSALRHASELRPSDTERLSVGTPGPGVGA